MNFEIFGWMGFAITAVAFGIWNYKKLGKFFPHLNLIAAIFLIVYEYSISAWSLVSLHGLIGIASLIKIINLKRR